MPFKVEGEARFGFSNTPGELPQPPDNGEIKVQQADGLLVTRRRDGTRRYTDLRPMEEQLASGPLAAEFARVPRLSHRIVEDTDYQCLPTDRQVGMKPLTASRTIWLPDVDMFPLGEVLFIADYSNAAAFDLPISIQPGPGTNDVLGVEGGVLQIISPLSGFGFRRGDANLWIRA